MLPVRVKIILLIAASLSVSTMAFVLFGSNLIIKDKTAYILDFTFKQADSAAQTVNSQMERILLTLRLIGATTTSDNLALAQKAYGKDMEALGIKKLFFLKPAGRELSLIGEIGGEGFSLSQALGELGWVPSSFKGKKLLVGTLSNGQLVLAYPLAGPKGLKEVLMTYFDSAVKSEIKDESQIILVNRLGEPMLKGTNGTPIIPFNELKDNLRKVMNSKFESGIQTWYTTEGELVSAYQTIPTGGLKVVGLVPKSVALAAATRLRWQSIVVGIGLLLLSMGITLIFVRQLTAGLKQMVFATNKVSAGIFNFRVDTSKLGNDEIGALGASFNKMAAKINALMTESAKTAVVERESSVAENVRLSFFPEKKFEHQRLVVGGEFTENPTKGQAWWHHAKHNDEIVVLMCEGTGHALNAALLTASVHTAFSNFMATTRLLGDAPINLKLLAHYLNSAVYACGRGQDSMGCFAMVFQTYTGQVRFMNAGMRPAMLHRIGDKEARANPRLRFSPLSSIPFPPLGQTMDLKVQTHTAEMRPGDHFVFYGESLRENLRTGEMLEIIANQIDKGGEDAHKAAKGVVDKVSKDLGATRLQEIDDLAIVVVSVPKSADFNPKAKQAAA